MLQTAVILAGGYGTRLQRVISDIPKPMAPINGEPFLNYQLYYLKKQGIRKIIFSVGHLADKIKDYYKDSFHGLEIRYVKEPAPMGTGGGIRLGVEKCEDKRVLALNGDSFFDIDLADFLLRHKSGGAEVSLALRQVDDAARYGTIQTNDAHRVISFHEKNNKAQPGLINGGAYILEKETFLSSTVAGTNFSIEKDFFETHLNTVHIKGFQFNGYFIDIGIPEDYSKAQHDFKGFEHR